MWYMVVEVYIFCKMEYLLLEALCLVLRSHIIDIYVHVVVKRGGGVPSIHVHD